MKKTFECDETIIISIPIGNLKDAGAALLLPEKFNCVFKDAYKVFVLRGKPKPLGAAQVIAGVFLCTLCLFAREMMIYAGSSALFVVSGLLSYAVGKGPHMCVAKLSLFVNIIGFVWSVVAFALTLIYYPLYSSNDDPVSGGLTGLILSLLVVESFLALFLIFRLRKAVCRKHFNTLPTILLKHGD